MTAILQATSRRGESGAAALSRGIRRDILAGARSKREGNDMSNSAIQEQLDNRIIHHGRDGLEKVFLSILVRELFQAEQSAKSHPLVEAQRLGDVPPGRAMRAVSDHAQVVLSELPSLMRASELPVSTIGSVIGKVFSLLRSQVADTFLSAEKSYRGTLLGIKHGVDLVALIRHTAVQEGDRALAAWCASWLEVRKSLLDAAVRELAWFSEHPKRAMKPATDTRVAHVLHAFMNSLWQAGGA